MTRWTRGLPALLALPCLVLPALAPLEDARADPPGIRTALDALNSVHAIDEVALSPDGKRLVYGRTVRGRRGGADVDVSALYLVNAKDGSGESRLTACPGAVCDEHGAAWSPDGISIVFVTTDEKEQTQVALAAADGGSVRNLTHAHGPLDTPRFSPDGRRIAFLYSVGAPKTPGPLNPLARDAGVVSATVYEQRLAVIPAGGGEPRLLGPADLNIYEYDWSPDGRRFVVSAVRIVSCSGPLVAIAAVLSPGARPVRSVIVPPASVTIGISAATSHSDNSGSTMMSSAPSASSM